MSEYDIDLDKALVAAMEAARKAGNIMWEFYQYRHKSIAANVTQSIKERSDNFSNLSSTNLTDHLHVTMKSSSTDLVTQYDKLCDETIMKSLKQFNTKIQSEKHAAGFKSFEFQFITEEITSDAPLTNAPTWIVDPIDGTMSFIHGGYDCCVSIGLTIHKKSVLAVVYCPFLTATHNTLTHLPSSSNEVGEMYTAILGKGAFLNGQHIHVCTDVTPKSALVVFNYPTGAHLSELERGQISEVSQVETMREEKHKNMVEAAGYICGQLAVQNVQGIRSYGACAFILSQIAAGRADLYMEPAGKVWDVCAGSLLVTEAGGSVKDIWGGEFGLEGYTTIIAAANKEMVDYGVRLCGEVNYGDYWKE